MKERRKANPQTIQGMRVPLSIHPNRFGEEKNSICNLSSQCTNSMTNRCMYCIKNFSTWTEGSYVFIKDDKRTVKPSGIMVPTLQADFFIKKPENV